MKTFIKFLDCGNVYFDKTNLTFDYRVTKLSDLLNKIIPFFKEFPIQGSKRLDFDDFCLIAKIMERKEHLTSEGLEQIRQIKSVMNTGRDYLKSNNLVISLKESTTCTNSTTTTIQKRSFHTSVKAFKRIGSHNEDKISAVTINMKNTQNLQDSLLVRHNNSQIPQQ